MNFERILERRSDCQRKPSYRRRRGTHVIDRTSSTVESHKTTDNDKTEEVAKKTIPKCFKVRIAFVRLKRVDLQIPNWVVSMTPEQETEMTYGQESVGSKPFGWCSNSTKPENGERPEAPCSSSSARISSLMTPASKRTYLFSLVVGSKSSFSKCASRPSAPSTFSLKLGIRSRSPILDMS